MLFSPRHQAVGDYDLEVNDGEASLADAKAVLGIVASGFFYPLAVAGVS